MKRPLAAALLIVGVACWAAAAPQRTPVPILPDDLRWASPPNLPGLRAAWVLGAENKPVPYLLRVKLAAGARIPPHSHPDERSTTVLSGTLYVGFGDALDERTLVPVPAGAVYVAPANLPHYVWARDAEAVYQEAGIGPTGTAFVAR